MTVFRTEEEQHRCSILLSQTGFPNSDSIIKLRMKSKHEGKQRKERCYFKVNAVISNVKIYVVNQPSDSYVG